MTEDQIKHMVDRFLQWRLPKDFNPDSGISYVRPNYAPDVDATPSGTNLFDGTQAEAMVRFMVEGLADAPAPAQQSEQLLPARLADSAHGKAVRKAEETILALTEAHQMEVNVLHEALYRALSHFEVMAGEQAARAASEITDILGGGAALAPAPAQQQAGITGIEYVRAAVRNNPMGKADHKIVCDFIDALAALAETK